MRIECRCLWRLLWTRVVVACLTSNAGKFTTFGAVTVDVTAVPCGGLSGLVDKASSDGSWAAQYVALRRHLASVFGRLAGLVAGWEEQC